MSSNIITNPTTEAPKRQGGVCCVVGCSRASSHWVFVPKQYSFDSEWTPECESHAKYARVAVAMGGAL